MTTLYLVVFYMVCLIVNLVLFAVLKFKGNSIEDRLNVIEVQNWMIFLLIMLKLISMEA